MKMLKAKEVKREARIHWYSNVDKQGRIIDTNMRDGDEVVAIEWDDGSVGKENINDLIII